MNKRIYIILHIILMIYSLSSVCSKLASGESIFSIRFLIFYSMSIFLLMFYAIAWQQVIRILPLTTAFASKAFTTVWGLVWGCLFFGETITVGKILGVVLVIIGVIMFSKASEEV